MKSQVAVKAFIVLCLAALLTSCASYTLEKESLPPLRVEYTNWWGDYTILIAQELGLFKKHNVEVEPVYFKVFSETLPAMATGALDGGLLGLGDTININTSSPVQIVAVYDDGGTNYVVASPNILKAEDLKGKKIGVPLGSIYELFIIETLKEGGLTTRDVTLINMEVEDISTNLGSSIDAGYSWDPFASELLTTGANLLYKSSEIDTINPDVIVFRKDVIEERPQDVQAFLIAWFEAVEYRKANPEQANQIISNALDVDMEEINEASYIYTVKDNRFLTSSQKIYGVSNLSDAIKINSEFLIRIGALSKKPVLDELVNFSYIP